MQLNEPQLSHRTLWSRQGRQDGTWVTAGPDCAFNIWNMFTWSRWYSIDKVLNIFFISSFSSVIRAISNWALRNCTQFENLGLGKTLQVGRNPMHTHYELSLVTADVSMSVGYLQTVRSSICLARKRLSEVWPIWPYTNSQLWDTLPARESRVQQGL